MSLNQAVNIVFLFLTLSKASRFFLNHGNKQAVYLEDEHLAKRKTFFNV